MSLASVLKLIHVFAAFWLVTGIIGRYVALNKAEQSTDIPSLRVLIPVASVFERGMVLPGSFAVLIAGLVTAWIQGWPILGFFQGGASNWVLVSLVLFLSLIPVIIFIFVPRGKVFETAYTDAVTKDRITPELSTAFRDPVVRAGHIYEIIVMVVIVALMVLKPF
jgi:Predicted integral membrane protein (DUF2269)